MPNLKNSEHQNNPEKTEYEKAVDSWERNEEYHLSMGSYGPSKKSAIQYLLDAREGNVKISPFRAKGMWERDKEYYKDLGYKDEESAINYISSLYNKNNPASLSLSAKKEAKNREIKLKNNLYVVVFFIFVCFVAIGIFAILSTSSEKSSKKSNEQILQETLQKSIEGKPLKRSEQMHLDGLFKQMNK